MHSLQRLRTKATQLIIGFIWINALLATARVLYSGASLAVIAAAVVVSLAATAAWASDQNSAATRIVASSALSMSVIVLVYAFDGHSFQTDMHMYFFAVLAMVTGLCDWRALLACAGTTAVHHIVLNFLLPEAIYPGGADILRLGVHATILIAELGVLVWISSELTAAFAASDALVESVNSKSHQLEAMVAQEERTRKESSAALARRRDSETEHFVAKSARFRAYLQPLPAISPPPQTRLSPQPGNRHARPIPWPLPSKVQQPARKQPPHPPMQWQTQFTVLLPRCRDQAMLPMWRQQKQPAPRAT